MMLWQAHDHQYGKGKVHAIDPDDPAKLLCGKRIEFTPGQPARAGASVTCVMCRQVADSRQRHAADMARWNEAAAGRQMIRAREDAAWRARYDAYMQSPEWAAKRRLVLQRARYKCEGCARRKASQAHHLTYEHLGNEFLWELKAVCRRCHARFHNKPFDPIEDDELLPAYRPARQRRPALIMDAYGGDATNYDAYGAGGYGIGEGPDDDEDEPEEDDEDPEEEEEEEEDYTEDPEEEEDDERNYL
jgi:5-methylcytosine-specific restriction endonuclease McrA